jgi:membrane associated rhomboid family serine protease
MIPLSDSKSAGVFPFWTIIIIIANIVVFIMQLTTPDPDSFVAQYALIPSLIDFNNFATLFPFVSSQFLHGGFLHIISNMLFLWVFGDNVEGKLGPIIYPVFYILCGVAAAFAQYFFTPTSEIPMLGASGAVAGVLGAYFAWFSHHTVKTLVPIFGFFSVVDIPAGFMLFYWIATQFLAGAFSFSGNMGEIGGVAYFAHIGGFVAGWVIAKLFNPFTQKAALEEYHE